MLEQDVYEYTGTNTRKVYKKLHKVLKNTIIGTAVAITMLTPMTASMSHAYAEATDTPVSQVQVEQARDNIKFAFNGATVRQGVTLSDLEGHWAKDNILYLVNKGAINGYEDGTFRPNNTISNAEFLSISIKLMLKDKVAQAGPDQHWASGIYKTAVEQDIVNHKEIQGTQEDLSKPMTREDMAMILVRLNEQVQGYEEVSDREVNEDVILDYNAITRERRHFVRQAYKKGLLNGKGDGFDPKGNLTRAEAATAVKNLLEYKGGVIEITKPTPTPTEPDKPVVEEPEENQTREEKGIALAKKYLAEYPTMQTKVDHGLMFGGEGYTCEDAADFAQEFWEAFGNYDKDHLDDWLDGVSPYVSPGTVKDLKKIGNRIIKAGDSSEVLVFVDAHKVDLTGGKFTVPAVVYDLDAEVIMEVTVDIGGHNGIKGQADKHIGIDYYKIITVEDIANYLN